MAGPDRETSVSVSEQMCCGESVVVLADAGVFMLLLQTQKTLLVNLDDICPCTGVHGQARRAG